MVQGVGWGFPGLGLRWGDVQVMVNMHVQDFLMLTTTKLVTPAFTGS